MGRGKEGRGGRAEGKEGWEEFRIGIIIALAVSSSSIMNTYIIRRKKILIRLSKSIFHQMGVLVIIMCC